LKYSRLSNAGDEGFCKEFAMHSAYNLHPDRKAGLALAFIVFGSIGGASGVVVQMAGYEPNVDSKSVIAAVPLSPSATLSPAVSAPDKPQNSSLPSNSVQAAPIDAITTAATAPATTAAPELPRQPVAASKKSQKTARSQNRPDRGWYNAYAWHRPHADYARGRGYGHERPSSSW
jgi:hypothetical protein